MKSRRNFLEDLALLCIGAGIYHFYNEKSVKSPVKASIPQNNTLPKDNSVSPITSKSKVSTIADIQRMLGLKVDNIIGPQTRYGIETLLLELDKDKGINYRYLQIPDLRRMPEKEKDLLSMINQEEVKIKVRNIEAVAFDHFGTYIDGKVLRKEDMKDFLNVITDSKREFEEALFAFKACMNYEHGFHMPLNTYVDETTRIALLYAMDKGIDIHIPNYSNTRLRVDEPYYPDFIIPTYFLSDLPVKDNSIEGIVSLVDPMDPVIRWISGEIGGFGSIEDQASRLLYFVQDLDYSWDVISNNSKHPLKTLAERTGDCEDSSILYLSLLRSRGIDCCYIDLQPVDENVGHAMVGVRGNFEKWKIGGYYLAETTARSGTKIGIDYIYHDKPSKDVKVRKRIV